MWGIKICHANQLVLIFDEYLKMRKFFVYELLIGSVPIKITFDTKTIYLHIKGFEHDVYNRNDTNFTPESTTIDIIYFPSLESYHVTCNHR